MSRFKNLWLDHPNLVSFAFLAVGMLVILFFSARHVGFSPGQWLALAIATIVLAGLCVWIINWESGDEEESAG
jgi:K+ transporter